MGSYDEQAGHERPGTGVLNTSQQKEATLLIRWLYKRIERKGETCGLRTNKDQSLVKFKAAGAKANLPVGGKGSTGKEFDKLAQAEAKNLAKALIAERLQSLDLML
jgi:hypothetical protein